AGSGRLRQLVKVVRLCGDNGGVCFQRSDDLAHGRAVDDLIEVDGDACQREGAPAEMEQVEPTDQRIHAALPRREPVADDDLFIREAALAFRRHAAWRALARYAHHPAHDAARSSCGGDFLRPGLLRTGPGGLLRAGSWFLVVVSDDRRVAATLVCAGRAASESRHEQKRQQCNQHRSNAVELQTRLHDDLQSVVTCVMKSARPAMCHPPGRTSWKSCGCARRTAESSSPPRPSVALNCNLNMPPGSGPSTIRAPFSSRNVAMADKS